MTKPSEPRWTDLPPEERARRLHAPITIRRIGGDKSWGGCNTQDHIDQQRPATRDQQYIGWADLPTERE